MQNITTRAFQNDDDFWRVRSLLIKTHAITPPGFNWEIRRWDGWRFYDEDPSWQPEWEEKVRLWETAAGQFVGVVNPDGGGRAALQFHPDFYRAIVGEMVAWAEENLAAPSEDGGRHQIATFVYDYDVVRRRILERRGWQKTPSWSVTYRLRFGNKPIPTPELPHPYSLRTTRPNDEGDFQRIADILNAAFNRTFHNAAQYRAFTTHAPSFRHDLDLVAVAPDGSFASFVGVIFDDANRIGIFEPVCTHPDHRQKGLARALMFEGMRRLKVLGATAVYVGTGDMLPANRLYESVGFDEFYRGYDWQKTF
jgi:GNAT superfamily N-acetyltransferase